LKQLQQELLKFNWNTILGQQFINTGHCRDTLKKNATQDNMVAEIKQYANTVIIEILLQNINGSMMIMVLLNYLVSKMLL